MKKYKKEFENTNMVDSEYILDGVMVSGFIHRVL